MRTEADLLAERDAIDQEMAALSARRKALWEDLKPYAPNAFQRWLDQPRPLPVHIVLGDGELPRGSCYSIRLLSYLDRYVTDRPVGEGDAIRQLLHLSQGAEITLQHGRLTASLTQKKEHGGIRLQIVCPVKPLEFPLMEGAKVLRDFAIAHGWVIDAGSLLREKREHEERVSAITRFYHEVTGPFFEELLAANSGKTP